MEETLQLMTDFINSRNCYIYNNSSGNYLDFKERVADYDKVIEKLNVISDKLKELGFKIYVYE